MVKNTYFGKKNFPFIRSIFKKIGYIFVYLSYEDDSNNRVYFDDFKVGHTQGNVIQCNEYYPFGLLTENSWTRQNTLGNNFLYNGPTETNTITGWGETMFRSYDPVLGRFHQVDPFAHVTSDMNPYHYAGNNPIMFNDPLGLLENPGFSEAVWAMIIGAWDAVYEPSFGSSNNSGGGSGSWSGVGNFTYENGVLVSSVTAGQYTLDNHNGVTETFSWWNTSGDGEYWAPQSFQQALGIVLSSAINSIEISNSWSQTQFKNRELAITSVSDQVGFDIKQYADVMLLQEVIVNDTRLPQLTDTQRYANGTFSIIGDIIDWGAADAKKIGTYSTKAVTKTRRIGGVTGWISTGIEAYDLYTKYKNGSISASDGIGFVFGLGANVATTIFTISPLGLGVITTANIIFMGYEMYDSLNK